MRECPSASAVVLEGQQHEVPGCLYSHALGRNDRVPCLPLLLSPRSAALSACPPFLSQSRARSIKGRPATGVVLKATSIKQQELCFQERLCHAGLAPSACSSGSRVPVSAFGCFASVLCATTRHSHTAAHDSLTLCCLLQHGVPWMARRRSCHGEAPLAEDCLTGPPAAHAQRSALMSPWLWPLEALPPHLLT